jgi:hypothetical protein
MGKETGSCSHEATTIQAERGILEKSPPQGGRDIPLHEFDRAQGRHAVPGVKAVIAARPSGMFAEMEGEEMSNSRLLCPTQKELRRRFDLMNRMMQKRGFDTVAARGVVGGLAFLGACAKCCYCLHEEACRRWLTIRAPRRSPDFCPNAAFFRTCLSAH